MQDIIPGYHVFIHICRVCLVCAVADPAKSPESAKSVESAKPAKSAKICRVREICKLRHIYRFCKAYKNLQSYLWADAWILVARALCRGGRVKVEVNVVLEVKLSRNLNSILVYRKG